MESSLAIIAYRCEVAGTATESLDIQVRYFESGTPEQIEATLLNEPTQSYANELGQVVSWPIARVLAIEPFANPANGSEVVGFITGCNEFAAMAARRT